MSIFLFAVLVIWILVINSKLKTLSDKIDLLTKKNQNIVSCLSQTERAVQLSKTVEESDMPEQIVEQNIDNTPVQQESSELESAKSESEQQFSVLEYDRIDFQSLFLGNIANKIGALAIIVAVIIFVKIVSNFIVFTPQLKITLGYLFGFALGVGGLFMHKQTDMKKYSEVLIGTGYSVLLVTTFCAYSLLNVFGISTTLAIGCVLLLSAYLIADRMKTLSMLVLGLIGGYATTLFVYSSSMSSYYFLLFLNVLSLIYTLKNKQHNIINLINLFVSFFVLLPSVDEMNVICPLILWAVYVVYNLFRKEDNLTDNILIGFNAVAVTVLELAVCYECTISMRKILLIFAIVYACFAILSRVFKNGLYKIYDYCSVVFLWLLYCFMFEKHNLSCIVAMCVAAVILTVLSTKEQFKHLRYAVCAYFSTVFVSSMFAQCNGADCLTAVYKPVINPRTRLFAIPVASMFASSFVMKKAEMKENLFLVFGALTMLYIYLTGEVNSILSKSAIKPQVAEFNKFMSFTILGFMYSFQMKTLHNKTKNIIFVLLSSLVGIYSLLLLLFVSFDTSIGYKPVLNLKFVSFLCAIIYCVYWAKQTKSDVFKYIAIFLGFLLCHSESALVADLKNKYEFVISLVWVLYSGLTTVIGIFAQKRYFINAGICILILSILRIFLYDLANVDMIYKLVAFLVLGVVLMGVSYLFTKKKSN